MSNTKAVQFGCPDCEIKVQIDYLIYKDGELRLAAQCPQCDTVLQFDLNGAIAGLFDQALGTSSRGKPS